MKRKIVSVLMSVLMLGSIATGCNKKEEEKSKDGKIHITYWFAWKDKIAENNEILMKEFNESQDKIVVSGQTQGSYTDLHQKLKTAFTANEAPDVSILEIGSVKQFSDMGLVEDLTPFQKKDNVDMSDYVDGLMKHSYFNDKLYGIPYLRSTPLLYLNKTMLKKAGLDEKGPQSWEELEMYCRKLKKDGQVGLTYNVSSWIAQAFLAQAGGSVLNEDSTASAIKNNNVYAENLKFLKRLQDEGLINVVAKKEGADKVKVDFANQKTAMFFTSTADLTYNLQVAKDNNFELGTTFIPAGKNGFAVPTGGCNMVMMAKLPKEKQEAAWQFIKFMTDKERTIKASKHTGYLVTRKSAVNDKVMTDYYKERPTFKVAVDQLKYAKAFPQIHVSYSEILKELEDAEERIFTGKKPIEEEVDKFDKKINEIVKKK